MNERWEWPPQAVTGAVAEEQSGSAVWMEQGGPQGGGQWGYKGPHPSCAGVPAGSVGMGRRCLTVQGAPPGSWDVFQAPGSDQEGERRPRQHTPASRRGTPDSCGVVHSGPGSAMAPAQGLLAPPPRRLCTPSSRRGPPGRSAVLAPPTADPRFRRLPAATPSPRHRLVPVGASAPPFSPEQGPLPPPAGTRPASLSH